MPVLQRTGAAAAAGPDAVPRAVRATAEVRERKGRSFGMALPPVPGGPLGMSEHPVPKVGRSLSYAGGNAPLRVTGWCPGCSCEGSRHRRPGPFFGAGATPLRSSCHRGADDEDGVTCGLDDLKYVPGRKYTITAKKALSASGAVYTGTVKDVSTGKERTIGAWRLPSRFPGFRNTANAFIEKFAGIRTCADIPAVTVSYTDVKADRKPLTFRSYRHKATGVPGKDIYTCVNVSDYTVTSRAPGSYTVRSHVPRR
ncbi:hypothetical protein ABZ719_18540 [Streptomyces sp. NPDC006743]|uniref:hypothetical protein n=1 Tax=Streptomyces sp. NPDC006743 TaxID=3154480 RepID=UPI003456B0C9